MRIFDEGAKYGYACSGLFSLPEYKLEIVPYFDHTVDLLILGGGEDVDPGMYCHTNVASGTPNKHRESEDMDLFHRALEYDIPILGICRGAQILNVLNGGWLVQHVSGHTLSHLVHSSSGEDIWVNSTHHQMMVPGSSGLVLGDCAVRDSHDDRWDKQQQAQAPDFDNEIVYYPSASSLCVQFHPEYEPRSSMAYHVRHLVKTILLNKPVHNQKENSHHATTC